MGIFSKAVTVLLACFFITAAQNECPSQPADGLGGKSYPHVAVDSSFHGSSIADWYWILEPASPRPESAYVVIYWHGRSSVSDPGLLIQENITYLKHLARKGYIVIFPAYQYNGGSPVSVTSSAWIIKNSFDELNNGDHVRPKKNKYGSSLYSMVGYAEGAVHMSTIVDKYYDHGLIAPSGLLAFNGPIWGTINLPPETIFAIVGGESDNVPASTMSLLQRSYDAVTSIPCENRSLIKLRDDSSGTCILKADHSFHGTSLDTSDSDAMNPFDWYASYKYSIALLNCAFENTDCEFILWGGDSVTYMGVYNDGTPIRTAEVLGGCRSNIIPRQSAPAPAANGYLNKIRVNVQKDKTVTARTADGTPMRFRAFSPSGKLLVNRFSSDGQLSVTLNRKGVVIVYIESENASFAGAL